MAHIALNDVLGLDINGTLAPAERISKLLPDFLQAKDQTLDKLPIRNKTLKLSFAQPIATTMGSLGLKFGGSSEGTLELLAEKARLADGSDPLSAITVDAGEMYLGLKLAFALDPTGQLTVGPSTFGFSDDKEFEVVCFRRFRPEEAGFPSFSRALGLLLNSFAIPRSTSELAELNEDTLLLIKGVGELSFSAGVSFKAPVESIAETSIGFGKQLQLQAGASVLTQAKFSLAGGFGVRLRGIPNQRVELGLYQFNRSAMSLKVSAQVGLTAGTADFDLIEKCIGALSRQPEIDKKELAAAIGGGDTSETREQIASFQSQLSSAVSQKLEASVTATLARSNEAEPMWMFEVDPTPAMPAAARNAIDAALNGDFVSLTDSAHNLQPAVISKKDVLKETKATDLSVQLNLFGIVNALSLVQIVKVARIERDPSGAVTVITDVSDVTRLQALLLNAGWDAKRLRKLLSEEFLLSATYQVAKVGVLPPEFTAKHTYLDIASTSKSDVKERLDLARILGLMSPADEAKTAETAIGGRTTTFVQTTYSNAEIESTFLDAQGRPRRIEEYEKAGRSALAALLAGRPGQDFRMRFASLGSGDALWQSMKQLGNTSKFGLLFGIPESQADPRISAVGTDYVTITDWAKAMSKAASAVYQVDALLKTASVQVDDGRLSQARKLLSSKISDVTRETHDEFGDPLGLLMVYVASNESAMKRFLMTGEHMKTIDLCSEAALTATSVP